MQLDPRTPKGAKIFSYNVFLNITNGSSFAEYEGDVVFRWSFFPLIALHDKGLFYYHYYVPQIGIKVPGMEVSQSVNLTGPIEKLFPVSNTEIEQCSWGNSTFIKVPIGIYLLSPYVFHLGTLVVDSIIIVQWFSQANYIYFGSFLTVETSAGEKHKLLHCSCNIACIQFQSQNCS